MTRSCVSMFPPIVGRVIERKATSAELRLYRPTVGNQLNYDDVKTSVAVAMTLATTVAICLDRPIKTTTGASAARSHIDLYRYSTRT